MLKSLLAGLKPLGVSSCSEISKHETGYGNAEQRNQGSNDVIPDIMTAL